MTRTAKTPPATVQVHVPMTFTIRGGRKLIVGEVPRVEAPKRTEVNSALIKALARAYRWRALIEDGTYASITELAKDKAVNQSYACRLLRLTLLSPQIVEAILNDTALEVTLGELGRPFPIVWADQQQCWPSPSHRTTGAVREDSWSHHMGRRRQGLQRSRSYQRPSR